MLSALILLAVALLAASIVIALQRKKIMEFPPFLTAAKAATDAAKVASDAKDATIAKLQAQNTALSNQLSSALTMTPDQESTATGILNELGAIAGTAPAPDPNAPPAPTPAS